MKRLGAGPIFGILLCIGGVFGFAFQDGVARILSQDYPINQFLLLRYIPVLLFAIFLGYYRCGDFISPFISVRPGIQILRSTIAVTEVCIIVLALRYMPLADLHGLFVTFPLVTLALAGLFLGEPIGWRRWSAVFFGFLGALIIIRPGFGVFDSVSILPLIASVMFAVYSILTRVSGLVDSVETSLIYMSLTGIVLLFPVSFFYWEWGDFDGWVLIGVLGFVSTLSHYLYTKALEWTGASVLQPFNYLLFVFAIFVGIFLLGEYPDFPTLFGAGVIVGSGLFAFYRERLHLRG